MPRSLFRMVGTFTIASVQNAIWNIIFPLPLRQVVDLLIKKITHAPDTQAPQPYIESAKNFMMSPNPLHVEARLDKEVHYILTIFIYSRGILSRKT